MSLPDFTEPQFIETADRVFGWKLGAMTDDGDGSRWIHLWIERGPPLSTEEAARIQATIIAELVGNGVDVLRWSPLEDEP